MSGHDIDLRPGATSHQCEGKEQRPTRETVEEASALKASACPPQLRVDHLPQTHSHRVAPLSGNLASFIERWPPAASPSVNRRTAFCCSCTTASRPLW